MNDNSSQQKIVMFQGERALYRLATDDDLEPFLKWFNDLQVLQYVLRYLPMFPKPEFEWIRSLPDRIDTDAVFVIEVEGRPIGTMGLHSICSRNQTATVGITIGEKDYWGQGYGTEALELLLDYGFRWRNLRKIRLSVLSNNPRGVACYRKCGFTEEGRLREQHARNGSFIDEILMGIFQRDWLEHHPKPLIPH